MIVIVKTVLHFFFFHSYLKFIPTKRIYKIIPLIMIHNLRLISAA